MSARLPAGELDRRIRIVPQSRSQAADGEPIPSDGPHRDLWAKRLQQRVTERFSAASDQVLAEIIFRVRWRDDIKQDEHIVVFPAAADGDRYEITGIEEYGRRVGLDLACKRLGRNVR